MEWQKKFEVGHNKIDMEHRVFFELVKSIAAAEAQGASRDKIRRLIAETTKYAEFHFLSEENIMIDVGYPEFEEHRELHKSLLRKMQKYVVSFESGDSDIHDLVDFLVDWFVKHTTTKDLLLSKYIKQA
ncbi:bacteriohemerythrin [endosymbiont of Lamellibrachia barhami]|uniref:bacteriohemerythrin n=1 Tax=endosymbiont of Lamellibrachia barhami TaxID=205975 RepID=UPI0015ABC459|nr:hemerythrin family protein [endosymbiont of Lamellibrachia barhami]